MLALVIAMLTVGGCATQAQREMSRMSEAVESSKAAIDACDQRMEQSAPCQALKGRLGPLEDPAPLALKASQDKASLQKCKSSSRFIGAETVPNGIAEYPAQ
jgi:hypothetical protein